MKNFIQKKNSRPPSSTSSGSWRISYWPKVLMELEKKNLVQDEILEVFLLTFAALNEKNTEMLNSLFDKKDIISLTKIIHKLPVDFLDKDYDELQVIYIITKERILIGLFTFINYNKLELIRLENIPPFDLKIFVTRKLIFPV